MDASQDECDAEVANIAPDGMRHHDKQLEEMLNLAKGCLRRGSVPGQSRPRDLFERLDAEAAAAAAATQKAVDDATAESVSMQPHPPPVSATPEGLTTEARIAKLRRDIQQIEGSTSKKRQELEDVNKLLTKEVQERCQAQDDLQRVRSNIQRNRRAVREAKDMFRIQEKEIQELHESLANTGKHVSRRSSRGAAAVDIDLAMCAEKKPKSTSTKSCSSGTAASQKTPAALTDNDGANRAAVGLTPQAIADCPSVSISSCSLFNAAAPKQKVYASVLTSRPKNYKLFM